MLRRLIPRRLTPTSEIDRLLIVRTDELGDVILTLPLAAAVKKRRPDIDLGFLVSAGIAHIVDRIVEIDRTFTLPEKGGALPIYRDFHPDAVIFAHPDLKLIRQAARAKIDVRVGPGYRWYSSLLTRWVYDRRSRGGSHEAEFELNMLEPLFEGPYDIELPELPVMAEAAEEARTHRADLGIGDRYGIIHPIGKPGLPDYPIAKYVEVAQRLLADHPDLSLIVTAGKGERATAEKLVAGVDAPGRIAVSDSLSPNGVSELLREAAFFLASASDGAHLAGLVGTPVVALFSGAPPDWPQRRRPLGNNITTLVPDRNEPVPDDESHVENPERVVARIAVERVVSAVSGMLG